ncbi:MAG: cytochrome b5 domain-containing protein [Leptospiraceae bacterium]|nr:cytochrome b5 domain-containing protein [Leptospiraceae bacterium]
MESNEFSDLHISENFGFLPPLLPIDRLPNSHKAWDQIASQIPDLFFSQKTQKILEELPLLRADESELESVFLSRASTILSILASCYWRHGYERFFSIRTSNVDGFLPDSIIIPWLDVTRRLGRLNPFQSATDLFLNNFKLRGSNGREYNPVDIKIENLDVLVPSFGNEGERVFYMSFVEIHACIIPVNSSISQIQQAILADNEETPFIIGKELQTITDCVRNSIKALKKINPNPKSITYCDPVLWAKTVAIFAVPPNSHQQGGTSGASTPFIHLLDALIGRQRYRSHYGQYVKFEGMHLLPNIANEYINSVRKIGLRFYLEANRNRNNMSEALIEFNNLIDAYAGQGGWLDEHVSKVFNYLAVATLVGRNQSTSGHERHLFQETWVEVALDLKIAVEERTGIVKKMQLSSKDVKPFYEELKTDLSTSLKSISRVEVAMHYKLDSLWVIIDNSVYDVTLFLKAHPGGMEILRSYCGRDATKYFSLVWKHSKMGKKLDTMRVAILKPEIETANKLLELWYEILDASLRTYALLEIQYEQKTGGLLEIIFAEQTHQHFCLSHLINLFSFFKNDLLSQDSIDGLFKLPAFETVSKEPWSKIPDAEKIRQEFLDEYQLRIKLLKEYDLSITEVFIEGCYNEIQNIENGLDLKNETPTEKWILSKIVLLTIDLSKKLEQLQGEANGGA